jgi:hypothetical protein
VDEMSDSVGPDAEASDCLVLWTEDRVRVVSCAGEDLQERMMGTRDRNYLGSRRVALFFNFYSSFLTLYLIRARLWILYLNFV